MEKSEDSHLGSQAKMEIYEGIKGEDCSGWGSQIGVFIY